MLRKTIFLAALLSLSVGGFQVARAQSDERKFEVGGQFTLARLPILTGTATTFPCTTPPCPVGTTFSSDRTNEFGFGARVGYNVNSYVTLEAEGNFIHFAIPLLVLGGDHVDAHLGEKLREARDPPP